MLEDTLAKLEARIRGLSTVPDEKKSELADLFATLRQEVGKLPRTEAGHAESITRFAELSAHEATRADAREDLQRLSLEGFSASAKGFEASHPRLVEIVNSICTVLSNMGV